MATTSMAVHDSASAPVHKATHQDVLDAPAHRVVGIVDGAQCRGPTARLRRATGIRH